MIEIDNRVRTAAFVLARGENRLSFEILLEWMQSRADDAKRRLVKPTGDWADVFESERLKGAAIGLETAIVAIRGMADAHQKDLDRERDREFEPGSN